MSKNLVEYTLSDGASIVFETDEKFTSEKSKRLSGGSSPVMEKAEKSLQEVSERIGPAAQTVLESLKSINTPEEIQMEFGLKFGLNAGVIIATADSAVNFKVTVKWVNKDVAK